MKKIVSALVAYVAIFGFNTAVSSNKASGTVENSALRVLDYTWKCVGSGGTCGDTIVVKPPKEILQF